jgi:membrane protein implicated in regulation of membrane protease activity
MIDNRANRTIRRFALDCVGVAVSTWLRYLLFQIPGWLLAAGGALALWRWEFLPPWLCIAGFCAWALKDLALYPLLWRVYEIDRRTGAEALIGARGFAQEDLEPSGFVRVRGELWNATVLASERMIAAGVEVEIVGAERMTVFVRAVDRRIQH